MIELHTAEGDRIVMDAETAESLLGLEGLAILERKAARELCCITYGAVTR
jgi:hypothetical protein